MMLPIQNTSPTAGLDPVQNARFLRDLESKLLEVKPIPSRLPSLKVGEEVSARVVNTLADNRLVVMIKKDLLTLNINAKGAQALNAEPGATMKLKVASLAPRLTFLMSSEPNQTPIDRSTSRVTLSGATRYLSALLNQQNTQASPRLMQAVSQQLSALRQEQNLSPFLRSALERMARPSMQERMGLSQPSAHAPRTSEQMARLARPWLGAQTALLATQNQGSAINTQQMASGLRALVQSSGLFYESHIKQWFQGERPLSELLQQPQAKAELPRGVLSLLNTQQDIDEGQLASKMTENAKMTAGKENATLQNSSALGQVVAKQLDVLEFRQLALQGQLVPEQPFLLQIQEVPDPDAAEDREGDGEAHSKHWQTRLVLDMPNLGGVEARLKITPQGVQLHLMTEDPATAELAKRHQLRLQQGMQNAGLTLNQLHIEGEIHD